MTDKNNETLQKDELKAAKKAAKEAKKLEKVKKLFQKRYTKKSLNRKIYKKIFIPSDKEFIQGFIVSSIDEKTNKEYFEFDKTKINDKNQLQRINKIAAEIGRQRGRINILAVLGALACVFAVLFFVYIFRNVLAKKIVVGASEAAFGAKCEVSLVDFDLFKTRFRIQGYKVANKKEPMRNLFEIKNIDFYFNLLELSRGKFVAENMAIEGFTWNTARKTSGALPPKKQKPVDPNKKPNPLTQLINDEVKKVQSKISVDRGLKAIQDQVDPRKILEREKAAFKTPEITEKIKNSVDPMAQKWIKTKDNVEKQAADTVESVKKLVEIDINKINDVKQLQELIEIIQKTVKTGQDDFNLANKLLNEVQNDIKDVEVLARNASTAITSDLSRLNDIASQIKSFNIDTGKKIIADLINTFIIKTLGVYYPYFVQGMDLLQNSQKQPKKEKELTLAQKSRAMERLPGKTFIFGKDSVPTFLIRNISLSGHHPEKDVFAIGGTAKAITNDYDKLGAPLSINLNAAHGKLKETAEGIIDLRSYTKELVDTNFTFEGLDMDIPSSADAVPALTGILKTGGGVKVSKDKDVVIDADMEIMKSVLTLQKFEPAFVFEIYQNVLSDIKKINVKTILTINKGERFKLDVDTDVDDQIAAALKKEFARQVEKVKAELIKEGQKWLDEQKQIYQKEIDAFMTSADKAKRLLNDIKNYEKILDKKKAEAEKRIKDIAAGKIQEVQNEVKKEAENKVKDILKGFGF